MFLHSSEVVIRTQGGPDRISLVLVLNDLMVMLVNLDLDGTLLVSNLSELLDLKSIESLLPDELVSLLHTCELDVCFVCAACRLDSDLQNLTEALSQLCIEISLDDVSRQVLYDSCWPLLDQIEVGLKHLWMSEVEFRCVYRHSLTILVRVHIVSDGFVLESDLSILLAIQGHILDISRSILLKNPLDSMCIKRFLRLPHPDGAIVCHLRGL